MGCVGQAFVWTMVFLLFLFTVAIGLFGISTGFEFRNVSATGTVGTFTPLDRSCGTGGGCSLEGRFTSDDGTVVREDVELRGALDVGPGDPLPGAVDGVRLDAEADDPVAYTDDFSWAGAIATGVGFIVVGPAVSIGIAIGTVRYQAKARAARARGHGPGPSR